MIEREVAMALAIGDYETAYLQLYRCSLSMTRARVNHAAIEGHYDYAPVK